MSTNMQCRLSGESLKQGQEVVFLILEPRAGDGTLRKSGKAITDPTSQWAPSTVPLKGIYDGNGKIIPRDEDEKAAWDLLGAVYDQAMITDAGGISLESLKRRFDADHDSKNIGLWVVSENAYEWLGIEYDQYYDRFQNSLADHGFGAEGCFSEATDGMHPALWKAFQAYDGDSFADKDLGLAKALAEYKVLVDMLHDMGVYFSQSPDMSTDDASADNLTRIKLLQRVNMVRDALPKGDENKSLIFRCGLSGAGIGTGERFYLSTIHNNVGEQASDWGKAVADNSAIGQYRPWGPVVECTWENGQIKVMDERHAAMEEDLNMLVSFPKMAEKKGVVRDVMAISSAAMESLRPLSEKERSAFDDDVRAAKQRLDDHFIDVVDLQRSQDDSPEGRLAVFHRQMSFLLGKEDPAAGFTDMTNNRLLKQFTARTRCVPNPPADIITTELHHLAESNFDEDEVTKFKARFAGFADQVRDANMLNYMFTKANMPIQPTPKAYGSMKLSEYNGFYDGFCEDMIQRLSEQVFSQENDAEAQERCSVSYLSNA